MKYLYVSNKKIEGFCQPKKEIIGDFMFESERIYCTKLENTHSASFDFILKTYNFNILLVHITHKEIPIFMTWRDTYFPNGIDVHVNIYETRDIEESLYMLKTDCDLNIKGYFFKKFIPVLHKVTSLTDVQPI